VTALQLERVWPYAAAAGVLVAWWYGLQAPFPAKPEGLLSTTATAAAVLVGFLATAKAVVLGMTGSPIFQIIKQTGYHQVLFGYLLEAVIGDILLLVVSIIGFFVSLPGQAWFPVLWTIASATALCQFVRFTLLLFRLLQKA
jgi:hypothetical protein